MRLLFCFSSPSFTYLYIYRIILLCFLRFMVFVFLLVHSFPSLVNHSMATSTTTTTMMMMAKTKTTTKNDYTFYFSHNYCIHKVIIANAKLHCIALFRFFFLKKHSYYTFQIAYYRLSKSKLQKHAHHCFKLYQEFVFSQPYCGEEMIKMRPIKSQRNIKTYGKKNAWCRRENLVNI